MATTERSSKRIVMSNYLILITDVVLILFSIFLAYLLRFNFSIPDSEMAPLPWIMGYMTLVRLIFLFAGKSYTGNIRFMNLLEVLRIYLFNILGSVVFIATNIVSYYLINKTLFIPLTIVILEFLSTSFLLIIFRSLINVRYSKNVDRGEIDKLTKRTF
jgi:FlaA1/EpsC-like NDP-sugar epimerase